MYRISKACYDALFSPSRRMTARACVTLADGTALALGAGDFKQNGIWLDEATSSGGFDLGAAIISKLTLRLNNSDGRFNTVDFVGGRITSIHVGVADGNAIEWIPLGVFDIDSVKYAGSAAEIIAYDALSSADRELPALTCPVTLGNLIRSICTHCGIIWSGQRFLHDDYAMEKMPDSATCRDVISYAAALAGCYARMSREGQLTFGWYGENMPLWGAEAWLDGGNFIEAESGSNCDGGDFFRYGDDDIDGGNNDYKGFCKITSLKSVSGDYPLTVTGVRFVAPDREITDITVDGAEVTHYVPGEAYICGGNEYAFDLSENPLLTHEIPAVLAALGARLIGCTFSPVTVTCQSNPAFEPGDVIKVPDRRGNSYTALVNHCVYKFGSAQTLTCEAPTYSERQQSQYHSVSRLERKLDDKTCEKINNYNSRIQALNDLMFNSMGVYKTAVSGAAGKVTYYAHNAPTLAASSYVSCKTQSGFAYTNTGWNGGDPDWNYGMDAEGNMICHVLSAVGIVADWIKAGRIESADGKCYFDLDHNQLFASKIGLPKRYLSSGEVTTDTGASRAGIACHDEDLSDSAYFQLRPILASADGVLYGFGLFDQLCRAQMICASRADNPLNNAVVLYGYDADGNRHELLAASAVNGGVRISSMSGQTRIEVTDSGIAIYKDGTLVQSW